MYRIFKNHPAFFNQETPWEMPWRAESITVIPHGRTYLLQSGHMAHHQLLYQGFHVLRIRIDVHQKVVHAPQESPPLEEAAAAGNQIESGVPFSRPRSGPHTLPSQQMESILCHAFRDVHEEGLSIPDSLKK